jgi:two-component system LytT family response regulator
MIKVLIIDDEEDARIGLKALIQSCGKEIEIVGEGASAIEAIKLINKHSPDLVFLDIQMPGGTGFDLLDSIPEKNFKIIFTTAYDQHALKAIRENPVDYLLKPIDQDELCEAIERYKKQVSGTKGSIDKIRLVVDTNILFLDPNDIISVEADGRYSRVFLINGESHYITKNLGEFEKDWKAYPMLYRIHRSYLINLNHIHKIIREDGGYVELSNHRRVEISRQKKNEFFDLLPK